MNSQTFRITALVFASGLVLAGTAAAQTTATYDQLIAKAQVALKSGKLKEAFVVASAAQIEDTQRWEAPFIEGVALSVGNNHLDAVPHFEDALKRAPASKKAALEKSLQQERDAARAQRDALLKKTQD